jgi:hypothetical protein
MTLRRKLSLFLLAASLAPVAGIAFPILAWAQREVAARSRSEYLALGPGEDRERDPGDGRERRGEEEQRELAAQRHATAAPPPTAPSPPAPSS